MSFFTASKKPEDVKDDGGGKYINQSGFYPVTILAAMVDVNDKGARTVNLYLDHEGQAQPLFGAIRLDNNDGSPNFQMELFNKLCIICDIEEVAEPEEASLPIGKNKSEKDVMILPDFSDQEVIMRVQMEYSLYQNEIKEKKIVKNFFRPEDYASASEIVNSTEAGLQYEKEQKYKDNITYKDGLTEEDVQSWIANRTSGNSEKKKSSNKMSSGTNNKATFGTGKKKKFGS